MFDVLDNSAELLSVMNDVPRVFGIAGHQYLLTPGAHLEDDPFAGIERGLDVRDPADDLEGHTSGAVDLHTRDHHITGLGRDVRGHQPRRPTEDLHDAHTLAHPGLFSGAGGSKVSTPDAGRGMM